MRDAAALLAQRHVDRGARHAHRIHLRRDIQMHGKRLLGWRAGQRDALGLETGRGYGEMHFAGIGKFQRETAGLVSGGLLGYAQPVDSGNLRAQQWRRRMGPAQFREW